MAHVWYSLIGRSFWHCLDCMSTAADICYAAEIKKTKCIEISTYQEEGFSEMSGMALEIEKLVSKYPSDYNIKYHFK